MGKTNSKILARPVQERPSITCGPSSQKESLLKKIYASEKKMIIYNCCPKELTRTKISKRLGRLIKKRRYFIKSVKLDSNSLDPKNKELLRIVSRLKSLSSLDIQFWGNHNIPLKSFMFLSKVLVPLKYLKSCTVVNHDPNTVSLKGSSLIMYSLSLLQKIKKVNLSYTTWMHNNANEEAIKYFLSKTSRLWRVGRFDLDLSSCEHLTDEALTHLGKKLGRFGELKELRLDLSYICSITQIGIKLLLENICLLPLVSLELRFGGHKTISDEGLVMISEKLRKIKSLRSLALTFEGFKDIQQAGFITLFDSINQMTQLQHLLVDLSGCQGLMDYEMTQISQNAAFFERLTHLRLDFKNCSLSDIGIIHLSQSFKRLVGLKGLSISFGGHENIMDHALISLGQALAGFKSLMVLEFEFSKTKITDSGLEKFAQDISKLGALTQLDLNFTMNQKITGRGVSLLGEALTRLKNLSELMLDFSHSTNITGDGVINLTVNIAEMKKLTQVKLRFQNCMKISKTAQDALKAFES